MVYSGMCRCGGAMFDGRCPLCGYDGPGRGSKYVEQIPEGAVLSATVTFFNRCADRGPNFVVAMDLPQGRIEACSGVSFPGAITNFARVFGIRVPRMVQALPTNQVDCVGLRSLDLGGEHE